MRCTSLILASLLSIITLANKNSPSDWASRKSPSKLIAWTTDPNHAFWKKLTPISNNWSKRSPTTTPLPTPTKCTYVPENTANNCPRGCICDTQCASIFFTNLTKPPESRSQYHVCTNWMLNHASQLRFGFQQSGFTLLDRPNRCGWQSLPGVSAMRVGRGSVDVNGTEGENWGNEEELRVVRGVMEREYPFIEVLIICATTVGPVFSFLGMGIWSAWVRGGGKHRHS